MDLTTLTRVKALLEQPEADWDGLITELIGAVSQRCASYCNRDFENKSRVEYHDGGGQYLYLKGLPVACHNLHLRFGHLGVGRGEPDPRR